MPKMAHALVAGLRLFLNRASLARELPLPGGRLRVRFKSCIFGGAPRLRSTLAASPYDLRQMS